ncbi:hypothetical protein [Pleionea sp. CnH1-48]|uniref:hypothetical protein n=1 Tax=Pleionea sp. CnH1-48 TaxID=2954494 RepID=UPI002096ABCC|nr:hypothetical protein [Pleionea sp. CnH1-48]MCO7223921.1 hypothetical protein [Pleionea sp. CnH1-48]
MSKSPCYPEPLAISEGCELWHCADCNSFHIRLGETSLHLSHERFSALASTLRDGIQGLNALYGEREVVEHLRRGIHH